jgi:hypothetical protein
MLMRGDAAPGMPTATRGESSNDLTSRRTKPFTRRFTGALPRTLDEFRARGLRFRNRYFTVACVILRSALL